MKRILNGIIVIIFVASFAGALNIFIIQRLAVSEKTFASVADNKDVLNKIYNEFIDIMSSDLVKLFEGVIPEEELKNTFRNAYPVERFKSEFKILLETIAKYLSNRSDSPNHNLNLAEFKGEISKYLHNKAEGEKDAKKKALLSKYSHVFDNYPDSFAMLRLDDIEHIDEMKDNLSRLGKNLVPFNVVAIISLIVLLFNIRLLGIALLIFGIVNSAGSLTMKGAILNAIARNPEPARTVAINIATGTINTIVISSIIFMVSGILILSIIRKKRGGK